MFTHAASTNWSLFLACCWLSFSVFPLGTLEFRNNWRQRILLTSQDFDVVHAFVEAFDCWFFFNPLAARFKFITSSHTPQFLWRCEELHLWCRRYKVRRLINYGETVFNNSTAFTLITWIALKWKAPSVFIYMYKLLFFPWKCDNISSQMCEHLQLLCTH